MPITKESQLVAGMITTRIRIMDEKEVVATPLVLMDDEQTRARLNKAKFTILESNTLVTSAVQVTKGKKGSMGMSEIVFGVSKVRRNINEIPANELLNHEVIDIRRCTYNAHSIELRLRGRKNKGAAPKGLMKNCLYEVQGVRCKRDGVALNGSGNILGMDSYNTQAKVSYRRDFICAGLVEPIESSLPTEKKKPGPKPKAVTPVQVANTSIPKEGITITINGAQVGLDNIEDAAKLLKLLKE